MYEQGDAPNFSVECWTSVRNTLELDFPTIPYLIDNDTRITDPYAIMIYIAAAYAPELLGDTAEAKAEVDMLYSQLKDVKSAITGPCYVGQDRAVLKQTAKAKMAPIVQYMGKKDFLTGDSLTCLDFYMLELCDFVQWLTDNDFFTENKMVARYVKKMKGLRQIKRYIMSDRFVEKPYNNKVAKINNM
jgi:glutathione S-transferase